MSTDMAGLFERLGDEVSRAETMTRSPQMPPIEVRGTCREEMVVLTFAHGRFTDCQLHPVALRRPGSELAELLLSAANDAIDQYGRESMKAMQDPHGEFGALHGRLQEIGTQAQRSMEQYLTGMQDMLDKARERTPR